MKTITRVEKNQHHLVSAISTLVAVALGGAAWGLRILPEAVLLACGILFTVLMVVRTILIEAGIGRTPTAREADLEQRGRHFLRKTFGVQIVNPTADPEGNEHTEQNTEAGIPVLRT